MPNLLYFQITVVVVAEVIGYKFQVHTSGNTSVYCQVFDVNISVWKAIKLYGYFIHVFNNNILRAKFNAFPTGVVLKHKTYSRKFIIYCKNQIY